MRRKSKNVLTPLNKKLLMALVVIVLVGVVIVLLNPGLTGFATLYSRQLDAPSQQLVQLGLSRSFVDSDRDNLGIGLNPKTGKPRDNCPLASNANQRDKDNDGIGDVCDPKPTTTCVALGKKDNDGDNLCAGDKDEPNDAVFNYLKSRSALPKVTPTPPPALAARVTPTATPAIAARPSGAASPPRLA